MLDEKRDLVLSEPSADLIDAAQRLPDRDYVKIQEDIKAVVCASGAMARNCIYVKPVGKQDSAMQFAIGPSIRMTEVAHQHFGFMWLNGGTLSQEASVWNNQKRKNDPGSVTTKTMCFDLKTCNITFAEDTSPVYSKNTAETARDRSFALSRRDAILQQVRPQLEAIMDDVKDAILKDASTDEDFNKLLANLMKQFEEIGIQKKEIEAVTRSQPTGKDKAVVMVGIWNALRDGKLTSEKIFGHGSKKPKVEPPKAKKPNPRPEAEKTESKLTKEQVRDRQITDIRALALKAGYDRDDSFAAALKAKFEIKNPESLETASDACISQVLDYFMVEAEKQ